MRFFFFIVLTFPGSRVSVFWNPFSTAQKTTLLCTGTAILLRTKNDYVKAQNKKFINLESKF